MTITLNGKKPNIILIMTDQQRQIRDFPPEWGRAKYEGSHSLAKKWDDLPPQLHQYFSLLVESRKYHLRELSSGSSGPKGRSDFITHSF